MVAESALFGIAKSVLGALASPALDEFKLLWGQEEQLEGLHDTVATIQVVLHDAEQRQANDASVQTWLARLRVVLYDADDLFDEISYNFLHEKARTGNQIGQKVRRIFSKPRRFAFVVKTAHKVKAIRERLDAIASDIRGFGFLAIQAERDQPFRFQREQTHSYVPRNEVIGRDQEREDLVKMLLPEHLQEDQRGVSVVAVIGIGGLGKTTLSQLVYNDERVQRGFDLCVWACINYFSRLEQVLVELIKSVTKCKVKELDLDTLQSKFREEIEGKRFLLVLDDVWDEDPQNWHKLKMLLDCGKPGSMVMTTTRSVKVAQSLSAVEPYYHLQHMSDESAWLLFKNIAFGGKHLQHSSRLEGLGQQIVKKCGNVPLVIVTIASLLRHQEEKKWCSLVEDELPVVAPGDYMKVMQALKFSYKEFPYPVKRCFAFCSLFPKDYIFEKDRLIRLWIAEGFAEPYDVGQNLEDRAEGFVEPYDVGQNLEHRAEEYFFYLVDRCFFQNIETNTRKNITTFTCQMHDLVHDLAKVVGGSESILVDQNDANRVCFSHHSKGLRTCILFKGEYVTRNKLNKLMSNFKALRVLDLSSLGIEIIPSSIGTLIHLRFLDLSHNYMTRLPNSICSLHHLQSLILEDCRLIDLPGDIGTLLNLRHLMLDDCVETPRGLATLTSLVTLKKLVIHKPEVELRYLESLNNLSGSLKIVIRGIEWRYVTIDAQSSYLSMKSKIKALTIAFSNEEIHEEVDKLMGALAPHPNLEYLKIVKFARSRMSIWVMCLDRLVILKLRQFNKLVELPPLSHLQSLKELSLEGMCSLLSIEGSYVLDDAGLMFFPSLETLSIGGMPNLKGWWEMEPAVLPRFPHVSNVVIRNCPELRAACMPLFPQVVEVLDLGNVQEEVVQQCIVSELGSSSTKKLILYKIRGMRSIGEAQLRRLSALQYLEIFDYPVSLRSLAYLTSLVKLSASGNIRWGVNGDGDDDEEKPEVTWKHLTRLASVSISNVNRSCFSLLKYLTSLQELYIYCFDEDLQSVSPAANNSEEEDGMPWKPLQKLRTMHLTFGETFSNRGNQQLLKGVEYLTNSLQELFLSNCKELYLSWRALLCLNHLEKLCIIDVKMVINVDDSTQIQQLSSTTSRLRELQIHQGWREWDLAIPWKSFPSLGSLVLRNTRNMEVVPEGIQHLASLQRLTIFGCERLVSLPNWISSLSSLRTLHVYDCSKQLSKRCKRRKG